MTLLSPRTTQASVDLDNAILSGIGVESILDVTFADDTEMTDNFQSSRPKHVVFIVGQCLGRCDDDRITGMRAKGIKILHVTTDDCVLINKEVLSAG